MKNYRVAAIQMVSGYDVEANLSSAEQLIQQAVDIGCQMVVLPENFAVLDSDNLRKWGEQERDQQLFSQFLSQQSQSHQIWIVGGSIPMVKTSDGEPVEGQRVRSACLVYNPSGVQVSRYDKIHLFDVRVKDSQGSYRESKVIEPGNQIIAVQTDVGILGQTICYDLRFPELYSALCDQGCSMFTVPSAFTYRTGKAHWESLIRARAIETQSFMIAPNQGGQHSEKRQTWGHSMIVDPWGMVLSQVETGPGIAVADLDFDWLQEIREAMPVQQHKRFKAVMT